MMRAATALFALAIAVVSPVAVRAHGIPMKIAVEGGKTFTSPFIGGKGNSGPFYVVSDNSPTNDPTSKDVVCGRVATKASSTPQVAAGSTLSYTWKAGYDNENGNWPHDVGPMMFYMAECSSDDCSKETTPGGADFFKVEQFGFSGKKWKQAELHDGKTVSFKIPSTLKPGVYLIRHEIINLALTHEMFPSCQRFEVTGSGSTALSGDSAKFPGAYSLKDKGLSVAGTPVYAITSNSGYVFPGPDVISLGSGDSGASSSSSDETSSKTSSSTSPTSTTASSDDASATEVPIAVGSTADSPDTIPDSSDSSADSSDTSASTTTASSPSTEASTTSSDSSSGSSSSDCAQQWTDCNATYMAGHAASDNATSVRRAAYTCQEEYTSCVAASLSKSKRMHRVRRNANVVFSH